MIIIRNPQLTKDGNWNTNEGKESNVSTVQLPTEAYLSCERCRGWAPPLTSYTEPFSSYPLHPTHTGRCCSLAGTLLALTVNKQSSPPALSKERINKVTLACVLTPNCWGLSSLQREEGNCVETQALCIESWGIACTFSCWSVGSSYQL